MRHERLDDHIVRIAFWRMCPGCMLDDGPRVLLHMIFCMRVAFSKTGEKWRTQSKHMDSLPTFNEKIIEEQRLVIEE